MKATRGNPKRGSSKKLWQKLRVGDRIRLTEVPSEYFAKGYYTHPDTIRTYKRLLRRKRPLRIAWIDEYGHPWIRCRFPRKKGGWEWHTMAFSHGGFVRIKPKRRRVARVG